MCIKSKVGHFNDGRGSQAILNTNHRKGIESDICKTPARPMVSVVLCSFIFVFYVWKQGFRMLTFM